MDACLRELLVQTIGVGRVTGFSPSGSPLGTTILELAAHVEVKASIVPDPGGTEKATTHLLITEEEIKLDDDVWLPGLARTTSNRRRPAAVDAFFDPITGSVDHYEARV